MNMRCHMQTSSPFVRLCQETVGAHHCKAMVVLHLGMSLRNARP